MKDASHGAICACGAPAARVYTAPSLHRLSDGPGSKTNHFMRSNLKTEVREQMKAMEDAGKLSNPDDMRNAQIVLRSIEAKSDAETTINYDKTGHPLDG